MSNSMQLEQCTRKSHNLPVCPYINMSVSLFYYPSPTSSHPTVYCMLCFHWRPGKRERREKNFLFTHAPKQKKKVGHKWPLGLDSNLSFIISSSLYLLQCFFDATPPYRRFFASVLAVSLSVSLTYISILAIILNSVSAVVEPVSSKKMCVLVHGYLRKLHVIKMLQKLSQLLISAAFFTYITIIINFLSTENAELHWFETD